MKKTVIANTSLLSMALACLILTGFMTSQVGWPAFGFLVANVGVRFYQEVASKEQWRRLTKWVPGLFFTLAVCLVAFSFLQGQLLNSLFTMLICAQGLTFLNLHQQRSLFTLTWVHMFLTAATMMYFLELYYAVILFLSSLLALFATFYQYRSAHSTVVEHAKQYLKLTVLALPVALILFAIMPRLPPLWQMPKAQTKTTGLQENLNPGDIAQLSLSSDLAFRVNFSSIVPPREALYWRGFTLDYFDGKIWQQSGAAKQLRKYVISKNKDLRGPVQDDDVLTYQVIAEASQQNWLFALDLAVSDTKGVALMPDYSLLARKKLNKKFQYQVSSYYNLALDDEPAYRPLQHYLQLPEAQNKKTREWALAMKQRFPSDTAFVEQVLNYFNQNSFFYTLEPKQIPAPVIDNFMFDSRQGFCGHYASAFAYIMRVAGIPARIVLGYLGGEHNSNGDYYSIYQFDAHAWVEIWQPQGWTRIDPTLAVAPERVSFNLQQAVGRDEFLAESLFSLHKFDQVPGVKSARMLLANIDYQWTRWILNYDSAQQERFLSHILGAQNILRSLLIAVSLIALLLVSFLLIWFVSKPANNQNKLQKAYKKALNSLEKLGIYKKEGETPATLLYKIHIENVEVAKQWKILCTIMDRIQYADVSETERQRLYVNLQSVVRNIKKQVRDVARK
ncbi:transglutaminaseTgpA domain-containing protein [Catenovulum sediminis]|uniref:TransglutaminaseTgpA domain-containing protein n=1 Tax=Catenovulum sediminis TaxID=1740262 RepID=A0ABV1REV0_9ALTE